MIRLRPHHGLCIRHFDGVGYSEEFVRNMERLIQFLEEDTPIRLTDGEDEICACCPYLEKKECRSKEKVDRYDKKVLEAAGIMAETTMTYGAFQKKIKVCIADSLKEKEICGDCGFAHICHQITDEK